MLMFRPLNANQLIRLQRILVTPLASGGWFMYKRTRKGHISLNTKIVSHTATLLQSKSGNKTMFLLYKTEASQSLLKLLFLQL